MTIGRCLVGFVPAILALASEPQDRVVESVLPALSYGPSCWSSIDLHNLGNRAVTVEVEPHRAGGALVSLEGNPRMAICLKPGERASHRLDIREETGDAWVRVREHVASERLWPVIAVSGATECVVDNQLRTTGREVAYPMQNPWFADNVSRMPGSVIVVVNSSEHAAKASLCYSAGNLYSVPGGPRAAQLRPICSQFVEVQLPPFSEQQFPVERDGNSYFSLNTQGGAIVLQMLRPQATGVKFYTVDSTIKFQQ